MQKRRNKYHAIPFVTKEGKRYDSTAEAMRAKELERRQERGEISDLKEQVWFVIAEPMRVRYRADFTYIKNGKLVVEDVKNPRLAKEEISVIKKKLMHNVHKIDVVFILPKDVLTA